MADERRHTQTGLPPERIKEGEQVRRTDGEPQVGEPDAIIKVCAHCGQRTRHGSRIFENPSIGTRLSARVCLECGAISELRNDKRPYTR